MKKIAFLTSYMATPHLETDLELIQLHLDTGDKVYQLVCERDWQVCLHNPTNSTDGCNQCISKRKKGVLGLKGQITIKSIFGQHQKYELLLPQEIFENFDKLKNFKVDNFDVGMAVVSTLVSYARTPYFDIKEHKDYIQRSLVSAIDTYYAIRNFLKKNKFDIFYIFNGRFTLERAALRACEYHNQFFFTHERGCDKNHYELFENTMPHSIQYNYQKMLAYWHEESDNKKREDIGINFFESKINNTWKSWIPFLNHQQANKLPDTWNSNKHNIIIFTSSDNEFVAIDDEWKHFIFESQIKGIQAIADIFRKLNDDSIQLYVRMHPNLVNYPPENEFVTNIMKDLSDIFYIIPADSPISSYALLEACDKVITFSSNMGLEATYFGKPSISLSASFYQYLDVVYIPATVEELVTLIVDKNLPAKDNYSTLIFGFYFEVFGTKYKYYQADTLFSGSFKGEGLQGNNIKFSQFHLFKQEVKQVINKIAGKKIFEIYV